MSSGMAPEAAERLRELTGPELYQRNAFRMTGIPTTAGRPAIRQRKKHVNTAMRSGADLPSPGELPVPGTPSVKQYGAAFDIIDHPQRRIVDEFFWLWGAPDGDCGCDPALHEAHDSAVRAHAQALDEELCGRAAPAEGERSWGAAAGYWRRALDHPGCWAHLQHRIAAVDDHRLDLSALSVLTSEVRRTLVTPMAVLAARAAAPQRMTALFGAWSWAGEQLLGEAVEQRLRPTLESVESALERARKLHAEHPARAVSVLEAEVLPQLARLRLFGTDGVRRPSAKLSDRAGLLLNNCAISSDGPSPLPASERSRLLGLALELATDEDRRGVVKSNQKHLSLEAAQEGVREVRALLTQGQADSAAAELENQLVPTLTELRTSQDKDVRDEAAKLRDQTALLLNDCAAALFARSASSHEQRSSDLLDEALRLAESGKARRLISKNRRRLTRNDGRRLTVDTGIGSYYAAFEAATDSLVSAQSLLRDGRPDRAASEIENGAVRQIGTLRSRQVRTLRRPAAELIEQTAILLNNCAVALAPEASAPRQESIRLLDVALSVARRRKTRKLVRKNRTGFIYAEQVLGNVPMTPRSQPGPSFQLEDQQLSRLPPSARQALLRLPPEQRAEALARFRDLLS